MFLVDHMWSFDSKEKCELEWKRRGGMTERLIVCMYVCMCDDDGMVAVEQLKCTDTLLERLWQYFAFTEV